MVESPEPEEHGPDGERVEAALKVFAALPPVQRSALALKDVLSFSLEETAATMGISVAAVKGALVRARTSPRPTMAEVQRRLVEQWHAMLKPKARVVSTSRMHPVAALAGIAAVTLLGVGLVKAFAGVEA